MIEDTVNTYARSIDLLRKSELGREAESRAVLIYSSTNNGQAYTPSPIAGRKLPSIRVAQRIFAISGDDSSLGVGAMPSRWVSVDKNLRKSVDMFSEACSMIGEVIESNKQVLYGLNSFVRTRCPSLDGEAASIYYNECPNCIIKHDPQSSSFEKYLKITLFNRARDIIRTEYSRLFGYSKRKKTLNPFIASGRFVPMESLEDRSSFNMGLYTQGMPDIKEFVEYALSGLKENQRNILSMRYFDGREFKEIANDFGITEEAVRQRYHKGILSMREIISRLK